MSTKDGKQSSPAEGDQTKARPRDPRHRKKMLVSGTMLTSASTSTVTLPEGVTSVPEGVELTRALSPVVNLEPLTAEIDFASRQVNMGSSWKLYCYQEKLQ